MNKEFLNGLLVASVAVLAAVCIDYLIESCRQPKQKSEPVVQVIEPTTQETYFTLRHEDQTYTCPRIRGSTIDFTRKVPEVVDKLGEAHLCSLVINSEQSASYQVTNGS